MKRDFLKKTLVIMLSIFVVALMCCAIWVTITINEVRNMNIDLKKNLENACYIIDTDGNSKKLTKNGSKDIALSSLSSNTINAFVAIEDKDFYRHSGISIKRMIKSALDNIQAKSFVSGGSTITQQLVKNKFLSSEKTLKRKVQEIYLAKKLEGKYDKDEILESYLNEIYFGSGAYGIENASIRYFGKSACELNLKESCVLASVINSPSTYSPLANLDACKARVNIVLGSMENQGLITKEEYKNALNEKLVLNVTNLKNEYGADLYDKFVLEEVSKILNVDADKIYNMNLKIFTGKNTDQQRALEAVVGDENFYAKNRYGNEASGLSMIIDNLSNCVTAVAGKSEYNLVGLKRSPASLIKPILVYAPAMEEGIVNPLTQIYDGEINYGGYSPRDVGGALDEYVSVEKALSKSLNIPAIKVCTMVGLDKCKNYANRCGLDFDENDVGYSLAIGGTTNGFTIKNILDSYSPLIYGGKYKKSNFVKLIKNKNNMTIYGDKMTESEVFGSDTAYLMTKMLINSTKDGTSKKLESLPFEIAGKTGTAGVKNTNENTDAYSIGYTTAHRVITWLGNYTMKNEDNLEGGNNGGTYATSMLKSICENILYKDKIPDDFLVPDSVKKCSVDLIKLEEENKVYLADENLPDRYKMDALFSKRFLPEKYTYENDDYITLSCEKNGGNFTLQFNANKYTEYMLYRECDGVKKLLSSYKNKSGEKEYVDNDVIHNKKYSYFLECTNKLNGKKYFSNTVTAYIPLSNSIKILGDDTDYSWLFA